MSNSVLSVETVEMLVERLTNIEENQNKVKEKQKYNIEDIIRKTSICPCWIQELNILPSGEIQLKCFSMPKRTCRSCYPN
uniref:Uncharacterized protein n=1 Tax=viral metagenome TaxID=1070528 RepID=A0A6C0F9L4_9ZZZZ|tara:strand:+ start:2975 stop:3214 length:240 start_codon:yes stop_codon:yes gene_type:complete